MSKRNYSIDACRFIAAIIVVLIHVSANVPEASCDKSLVYQFVQPFFEVSVPFFFSVSGFLLVKRERAYIQRYCLNVLSLFLAASLFYVVADVVFLVIQHGQTGEALLALFAEWLNGKGWMSLFNGTWGQFHLWYLFALVCGTVLWTKLKETKMTDELTLVISLLIYVISSLIRQESEWLAAFLRYGGFIKALAYLSIGAYVRQKSWPSFQKGRLPYIALSVLAIYVSLVNRPLFFFADEILLQIFIFSLLQWLNAHPGQPTYWAHLGEASDGIYVLHIVWIRLLDALLANWQLSHQMVSGYIIGVALICLLASYACYPTFQRYILNPLASLFI